MKPQDLVCNKCWDEFFNTESFEKTCTAEDDPYIHHETEAVSTIDEITNASSSGCNWCSFVETFLYDSKHGKTRIKTVLLPGRERHQATPRGRNVFFVRVYYLCGDEEEFADTRRIYAFTSSKDEASAHVTARPLRHDVGSPEGSLQMQSWLAECKGHEGCLDPHAEATLPTRVIEVRPKDQNEPRVVESGGRRGRYATVSYCWGKAPFDTLNTSNYAQFMESFDNRTLPLTFQQAIAVTRSLSIPYLWIDALCIIQDSEKDKNREISSMKDIYASSTLTIVAASAEEVSEGFLQDRTHVKQSFTIPFCVKPNVFGTFSFGSLDDASYDERSEPLAKRAWTLQEQLLAQRTVTFASHTMMWACKAGTKTFGDSFHYPFYDSMDTNTSLNLNQLLMDDQDALAVKYEALTCWSRLVSAYSLRRASLENDKLNAVAGIALHGSFAPALGPGYFAGLWTYKLALQLTWYVSYHHRSLPDGEKLDSYRPKTYRAPSWSWASIEGGMIQFDEVFAPIYNTAPICKVLDCSTTPKLAQNPFGEVVSGQLKVLGFVRTAWFYPQTSNLVLLPMSNAEGGDESIMSHEEGYNKYIEDFIAVNPNVDFKEDPEVLHGTWNNNTFGTRDETRFTEPMIVFCLATASEGFTGKGISGLLLTRTGNGSPYTRVGQFMRGRKRDFRNKELVAEELVIV
ncbi:unnamed protein product [Fusarium graminearum]|nr:hypothetical protein FGRA07_03685 [Fusarium graminearum]VTO88665.1 unnamed protein product [Fusarium graminearum]